MRAQDGTSIWKPRKLLATPPFSSPADCLSSQRPSRERVTDFLKDDFSSKIFPAGQLTCQQGKKLTSLVMGEDCCPHVGRWEG